MSHHTNGMTLAQEEQANAALGRENFDLKMQVQNLSQQLRKALSSLDGAGHGDGDTSLKLELQERQLELNERNMLLSKAKTAITEMRKELERVRRENDPAVKAELEARVSKLKQANEQLDMECRKQVNAMEMELVTTKEKFFLQDESKAKTETRLEQVELSLSHSEQRLAEVREEKSRIEENWLLLQQKAERMEEEVMQARAHVELYRMETQEAIDERDGLREQLAHARDTTHVADQLSAQRVELDQKHEEATNKIENLHRHALERHHLEMEKGAEDSKLALQAEKNLHEKHLLETTQRHESEMARLREEAMKAKDELRLDRQREREEAARRMDEKSAELKHMHQQLETQRAKADHQLKEAESARVDLESCKVELGFRADQADQYKIEAQELHAEAKLLKRSHEQAAELREGLRREQIEKEALAVRFNEEKETLQHKLVQLTDTLDNLKHSYHDKESRTKLAEAELSTIKASHSTVEMISRDNEKIKLEVTRLTQELLKTTHEASNLKRDVEHATNLLAQRDRTIELQGGQVTSLERENATLSATKNELNDILRADREKHVGMEALLAELHSTTQGSISEHKDVAATFKHELDEMEEKYLKSEKAHMLLQTKHETMRHDYINELQVSIEHLENWDGALTDLVDGVEGYPAGTDRGQHEQNVLKESAQNITRALSQKGFLTKGTHANIRDDDVGDHLLPAISSLTERIKIKMKRAQKLRQHLAQQMAKHVASVSEKFENTHQRNQLLAHRIDASDAALKRTSTVLDRDRKAAVHEQTEGKLFREQTMKHLNDNAKTLKEVEDRRVSEITAHLSQISQLQKDIAVQERAAEAVTVQIQQKDNIIADLRAEVDAYGQAEQVVQELSDRLQDVVAAKDSLSQEMQQLEGALDAAQREISELTEERTGVLERCDYFERQSEDLQKQLNSAAVNIESLQASQITPELAQMIRDTQNIIRSTKKDHESVQQFESSFLSTHPGAHLRQSLQQQDTDRSSAVTSPLPGPSPTNGYVVQMQKIQSSPMPASPATRTPLGSMLDSRSSGVRSSSAGGAASDASGQAGRSGIKFNVQRSTTKETGSRMQGSANEGSTSSARTSVFTARASPGGGGTALYSPPPVLSTHAQTFLRSTPNFSTGTPQRATYRESTANTLGSPAPSLRTPGSQPRHSAPAAGLTPNTQTRQSVHRLHKLGSDIEALARKLDGFDSADRNRWSK